ncbi:MAG: hypothetical protein AB7P04_01125 [Bacteriovoracia bacterium]
MNRIGRCCLGLWATLILFPSPSGAVGKAERMHPYLRGCGEFQVTGKLKCEFEKCAITVYPGSEAETKLLVESDDPVFGYYDRSTVQLSLRIARQGKTAHPLDRPRRKAPDFSPRALVKTKSLACQPADGSGDESK